MTETDSGFAQDGVTSGTASLADGSRTADSSVNLVTGSLRGSANQVGVDDSSAFFNSIMGDTITIRNGASKSWGITFAIDGAVNAALDDPYSSNLDTSSIKYSYEYWVYRAGTGVDTSNWFTAESKLKAISSREGGKTYTVGVGGDTTSDVADTISESASSSVLLGSDNEVFLLFAKIFGSAGQDNSAGLLSSNIDMSNTATFSFSVGSGVDIYSESGFLGYGKAPALDNGNVPEPGSLALVLAGLLGLGAVARKRRA